jgi:hypothetical protein|tara:strand:- start:34 stop:222 length:189 start_codon:yes stop_codon:yes gene_type:complete
MYKHINFTVIPSPGPNWGTCKRVDISIPKSKFKTMQHVYDLWYKKTGNVAKKITKGGEKYVN